jgi:ribonuclease E
MTEEQSVVVTGEQSGSAEGPAGEGITLLEPPAQVPAGTPVDAAEGEAAPAPKKRRRRGGRGRGRKKTATEGAEPAEGEPSEPGEGEGGALAQAEAAEPSATAEGDAEAGVTPAPKKRRRRGGRGRGRKKTATAGAGEGEAAEAAQAAEGAQAAGGTSDAAETAGQEAASAEPAQPEAQISTRLRRRAMPATRASGRRRHEPLPVPPRVTDKLMVITEHGERDQIAVLEGRELVQHYVTRIGARSMVGNVYLGRVQNVLPGMEAAFIDIGRGRNAVLYAGEVNYSPEDLEGSPPRIEKVLRPGQSVIVQVTKDPIGGKGARLTAQVSLPGRYLVLVPNADVTGISRRLPEEERKRLKAIYKKIRPEGHGLIVRTAAEGATEEQLVADRDRLLAEWAEIEKRAKKAKAPALLYEEPELTVRVVRDLFTDEEFRELVTDSPRVYQIVTEYLRQADPDLLPKVRLHEGPLPVFEEFHIVEQIHKGLDRKVWLPSGGYIVIDRTEALTVIDVNTGKSVGKTNLEETVVNTNLEAAREIARQLRLRDIGGMIVIDFIDMLLEQNKKKVIETLREALAQDKTRSQVFDISPLGLLEVTRKRVSGGLLEAFSETCPTCEGRGVLLTYDAK